VPHAQVGMWCLHSFIRSVDRSHPSIHPSIDLELSSRSESAGWLAGHAAAAKRESRNLHKAAETRREAREKLQSKWRVI
jgi:hypothetical protein